MSNDEIRKENEQKKKKGSNLINFQTCDSH